MMPEAEKPVAPGTDASLPQIRLTALLVQDGCMLAVRQVLRERSNWNLPGGRLEYGETLAEALEREVREECGLTVEAGELVYVTDRFKALGRHTVDMAFEVRLAPGERRTLHEGPIGPFPVPAGATNDDRISEVRMVRLEELPSYGFSRTFTRLAQGGFPQRGSYQGDFHQFYSDPLPLALAV